MANANCVWKNRRFLILRHGENRTSVGGLAPHGIATEQHQHDFEPFCSRWLTVVDSGEEADVDTTKAPQSPSSIGPFWLLLAVGLFAGVLGATALQQSASRFDIPPPDAPTASDEMILKGRRDQVTGFLRSNTFSGAVTGAVVAGVFGLFCGLGRRWLTSIGLAMLVGVGAGALFGAAAGYAGERFRLYAEDVSLTGLHVSLLFAAIFWVPLSLAVALAVWAARQSQHELVPVVGRSLSAVVATVVLAPLLGAALLPLQKGDLFAPPLMTPTYLLLMLGAGMIGLFLGWPRRRGTFSRESI